MIYPYACTCGRRIEVIKSASESSDYPICDICGLEMLRIWTVPQVTTKDMYTGYNPALGVNINNKSHLKDELRKHADKTGIHLTEIGNETARIKSKESDYNFTDKQCREIGSVLQSIEG